MEVLKEKGIPFETNSERRYYHAINRINLLSPSPFEIWDRTQTHESGIPLCILERKNDTYRFLYTNREFDNDMRILGAVDAQDMIQKLVYFNILSKESIHTFGEAIYRGDLAKVNFMLNGDYCSAKAKCVSVDESRHAILLSVTNVTRSMEIDHEQVMNQSMRNIYSMYLRVSVMRLKDKTITPVFEHTHTEIGVDKAYDLNYIMAYHCKKSIHPEDRQLYLDFMDPKTIESRIFASKDGFINTKIRSLDGDPDYTMKMYLALAMGNHEVLILVRHSYL